MDRLTKTDVFIGTYTNEKIIAVGKDDDAVETAYIGEPVNRLAEYEDTGLTPEEVVSLNTFTDSQCEKLLAKNGELEKEIKRLQIKLGDMGTVCHGCPYPRKYKKLEKELAHYKQLEADGRLIELPCKVGTEIYFVDDDNEPRIIHGKIIEAFKYETERYFKVAIFSNDYMPYCDIAMDDFQKLWFLTEGQASKECGAND